MTRTVSRWQGLLLTAAGCLVWLLTAQGVCNTRAFLRHAMRTEGVVLAWGVGGSAHPEVEFSLVTGEKVSFMVGSYVAQNPGERIPVLYLPEDPARSARVNDSRHLWQLLVLQFLLGFCLNAIGAWVLLNQTREHQAREARDTRLH